MESKQGSLVSNSSSSTQESSDDKPYVVKTDSTLNQGNDQAVGRQLPHSLKSGIVKNASARLANPYLSSLSFC
jgi:hypothetical protein